MLDNMFNYPQVYDDRDFPTLAQLCGIKSEEELERHKLNQHTDNNA